MTFGDSEGVEVGSTGERDRAGFVQVRQGRVTDRARARQLFAQLSTEAMARFRPEVLGSVMINYEPDRWAQVIYFTSEAEAREGERKEAPPEAQAVMEQLKALTPEPFDFIDLRQPLLYSPPAAGAGLPGPREAAEAAEEVERST